MSSNEPSKEPIGAERTPESGSLPTSTVDDNETRGGTDKFMAVTRTITDKLSPIVAPEANSAPATPIPATTTAAISITTPKPEFRPISISSTLPPSTLKEHLSKDRASIFDIITNEGFYIPAQLLSPSLLAYIRRCQSDINEILYKNSVRASNAIPIRTSYVYHALQKYSPANKTEEEELKVLFESFFHKGFARKYDIAAINRYFANLNTTTRPKSSARLTTKPIAKPLRKPQSKFLERSIQALSAITLAGIAAITYNIVSKDSNSDDSTPNIGLEDSMIEEQAVAQANLADQQDNPVAEAVLLDPVAIELEAIESVEPVEPIFSDYNQTEVASNHGNQSNNLLTQPQPQPQQEQSELARLMEELSPTIQPESEHFDITTAGNIEGQTPLFQVDRFYEQEELVLTVYRPIDSILNNPTVVESVGFEVITVSDPLKVRAFNTSNFAVDTAQRLANNSEVNLTGQFQYVQTGNVVHPYSQTDDGQWVSLLYLNPTNRNALEEEGIELNTEPEVNDHIVTAQIEQLDTQIKITDYSMFAGQKVRYTSKSGNTREYLCVSSSDGKMRLNHARGGSFEVNWSTLESEKASVELIQSDINSRCNNVLANNYTTAQTSFV